MDLESFTLYYLKDNKIKWLESRIVDWLNCVEDFLHSVLNGSAILIVTDYRRRWFSDYLIHKINSFDDFKPSFLPIFDFIKLTPQLEYSKKEEHFDMIEDMLSITFNDYTFIYVGKENGYLKITDSKKDSSLFAIFDKEMYKNFYLNSLDSNLDKKLIDLANILNETLKAAIFGDIEIG